MSGTERAASVPKAVALVEWLDCFEKSLALIRQYVEQTPVGDVTAVDAVRIEEGTERVVAGLIKRWAEFGPSAPDPAPGPTL